MNTRSALQVEGFFDPATWTVSYIVLDKGTKQCALIDSVLDFDVAQRAGRRRSTARITSTEYLPALAQRTWKRPFSVEHLIRTEMLGVLQRRHQ